MTTDRRNVRSVVLAALLALAMVGCADSGRATDAGAMAVGQGSTLPLVSTTVGSVLDDAGTVPPATDPSPGPGPGPAAGDPIDLGGTFRFRVDPSTAGSEPPIERSAAIDTALATATSSGLQTEGVESADLGIGELDKTDGTTTTRSAWLVHLRLPPTCASTEPCTAPSENTDELGVLIDATTGETLVLAVLPLSGQ